MTAEAEALARCVECEKTYAVYRNGGEWRALGTDGSCSCGSSQFAVLSVKSTEEERGQAGEF